MSQIIIMPLVAGLVAEALKFLIPGNQRSLSTKDLFSYSGMPSGHAAIVSSLAVIIGFQEGFNSSLFGLSLIFAALVLRDAIGLRQYLGHHGAVLNILIKDLRDDDVLQEHYPHLREHVGHTKTQVLAGIIVGSAVSCLGYIIFK